MTDQKTLLVLLAAAAALWWINSSASAQANDFNSIEPVDSATLNGVAFPRRRKGSAFKTA